MARQKTTSNLPAVTVATLGRATRAKNDEQLLESWLANLTSAHSRRNFEVTARRFLGELPTGGLRAASVEDVRDALSRVTVGVAESSGRQMVLRVKSLLSYGQRLGYLPFNAGATIRVRSDARNRGATLAKRIISEVDVALLVRGARTKRRPRSARGPLRRRPARQRGRRPDLVGRAHARQGTGAAVDHRQGRRRAPGAAAGARQQVPVGAARRRRRQRRGVRQSQDGCPAGRTGNPGPRQACRPPALASRRPSRRIGCVTPMRHMPSTAAPPCLRFRRPWGTATSRRRPAICTPGRRARAG
jgi:hypothetical protein